MYTLTSVTAKSIPEAYYYSVATALGGNSNGVQLHSVTVDGVFLCYVSVKEANFQSALTAVSLFGFSEECTLQSCLEISNRTFAELSVPVQGQRIQLFLGQFITMQDALLFFKQHGYEYEMSFGSDEVHDVLLLRKREAVTVKRRNLLQMLGLKSAV